jgi:glycosyltransferase involved in cell wall biosynthesis
VLLSVDDAGPTSRKGTLAGSLASGRPVVALDGPHTWAELTAAGAIELVPASPVALADVLDALLGDVARRETIGRLGQEFAQRRMSVAQTVDAINDLLVDLARSRTHEAARDPVTVARAPSLPAGSSTSDPAVHERFR